MRAIFLCENEDKCYSVYHRALRQEMAELLQMDAPVYKRADILASPEGFSDVRMVFSTWGMPSLTEEEIRTCLPALDCVFYGAGSVQGFARPFLRCGVRVFSAWAANAVPVAEFTVAQILLANKGYFLTNRLYRSRGWGAARAAFETCNGNYGETVGIIGAGMIGGKVIQMLKPYQLKVLVYDPFLSEERADELGALRCELTELFSRGFVVSNHLANNEQTKGMLTYAHFSRMRENAVFINTGRGAQVAEDGLARALRERPDLTALLDVTDTEPLTEGHPFYTLPNCLLTPHIAGSSGDEVARMGAYMLDECRAYLNGDTCRYEVHIHMLDTMA